MRLFLISILLIHVCFGSLTGQRDFAISQAQTIAQKVFEDNKFPGMAVGVMIDGEVAWLASYGYADVESKEPIDPTTSLFRIGSVSKTLTAVGLMQLVEKGDVDLDENVQTYVASFPEKEYPITVRQIAQHVAGIRHYHGMEFYSNEYYPTVTDGLAIFADDPLIFEPGTKYAYSSYGWNLVSAVMEGASGDEFLSYMDKHVFRPARMNDTYAEHSTKEYPGIVSFYLEHGEPAWDVDNSYKWAGGGFISTAADMLKFGDAVMENDLIEQETLDEALKVAQLKDGSKTTRGIGFVVDTDDKDRAWIGHSGGSVGGTTMFLLYPESKLCVVTLVNQSSARMGNLAFRIAEQFLSNPGE